MNIGFFEIQGWETPIIKKALKGHKVTCFKEPLTKENVSHAKKFDAVSVFIYSKLSKDVLDRLPKLKFITTRSTGFDHIDLATCEKHKIVACNVPYYGENTVAEHTFALILALSRNVHKSHLRRVRGDYSIEGLKGFDLQGKTIGIIGAGHIGMHVIRIARGFGMKVLATARHKDAFLGDLLDINYVEMDELIKNSDIISLHVPLVPATKHTINMKNIKQFKKGALLINTARGGLVETDAVLYGLKHNILSGVGLDVLEGEALIKEEKQMLYDKTKHQELHELAMDHELLKDDRVVFTPHIAFYSQEALERIIHTTCDNVLTFVAGSPQNTLRKH